MKTGASSAAGLVSVNAHLPSAWEPPPPLKSKRRCCNVPKWARIVIALAAVVLVAGGVVIALLATGVIQVRGAHTTRVRRISYDPLYYGNLHPYLYPAERAQFGVHTDWDVIVIGAGVAGLAAAQVLSAEAGLEVLVLEARVRRAGEGMMQGSSSAWVLMEYPAACVGPRRRPGAERPFRPGFSGIGGAVGDAEQRQPDVRGGNKQLGAASDDRLCRPPHRCA